MSSACITVPGRVNLIGEHIDYHHLPVLPMAIQRRVEVHFEPRADSLIHARSQGYPDRRLDLFDPSAFPPGDWGNYLHAAAQAVRARWPITRGIDASTTSNLSSAAGLSSSSALITAFALALLHANGLPASLAEMLAVLPEGEQLVGTRGGGMDHAAVIAARAGCALLVHFAPFKFEPIPIPAGWTFLVAHSLTFAEKSGALKSEYNSRRAAGQRALEKIGLATYKDVLAHPHFDSLFRKNEPNFTKDESESFQHVTGEAQRVETALNALRKNEPSSFGKTLVASHASLRHLLRVSNPTLDELVDCAMDAGALGARLTGAGFGGCAIVLCHTEEAAKVEHHLTDRFYAHRPGFVRDQHLFRAIPSDGALHA